MNLDAILRAEQEKEGENYKNLSFLSPLSLSPLRLSLPLSLLAVSKTSSFIHSSELTIVSSLTNPKETQNKTRSQNKGEFVWDPLGFWLGALVLGRGVELTVP